MPWGTKLHLAESYFRKAWSQGKRIKKEDIGFGAILFGWLTLHSKVKAAPWNGWGSTFLSRARLVTWNSGSFSLFGGLMRHRQVKWLGMCGTLYFILLILLHFWQQILNFCLVCSVPSKSEIIITKEINWGGGNVTSKLVLEISGAGVMLRASIIHTAAEPLKRVVSLGD